MSQVNAILDAVVFQTVPTVTTASVTPLPAPISMIGAPTVVTFSIVTDLINSRVQFSYLVYQTYNAAGGVTGLASVSGTSAWIATPGISPDVPGVSLSGVSGSSIISGTSVVFTINATVNYNEIVPGIYSVTVVP